jgi:hypothetical protein
MLQSSLGGKQHGGGSHNSNPLGSIIGGLTHSGGGHGGGHGGGGGGLPGKLVGQLASNLFSSNSNKPSQPQNYHGGPSQAPPHSGGIAGSVMGGVAHMFGAQSHGSNVSRQTLSTALAQSARRELTYFVCVCRRTKIMDIPMPARVAATPGPRRRTSRLHRDLTSRRTPSPQQARRPTTRPRRTNLKTSRTVLPRATRLTDSRPPASTPLRVSRIRRRIRLRPPVPRLRSSTASRVTEGRHNTSPRTAAAPTRTTFPHRRHNRVATRHTPDNRRTAVRRAAMVRLRSRAAVIPANKVMARDTTEGGEKLNSPGTSIN